MRRIIYLAILLLFQGIGECLRAGEVTLLVSAAVGTRAALQECAKAYKDAAVTFNFGRSAVLASQICKGAPVDLFVSAGDPSMERLVDAGLAKESDVRRFLRNRLVLVVPTKPGAVNLEDWEDLRGEEVKRFAIGDPQSVPSGEHTAEALRYLELWGALKGKLVYRKDRFQVLASVERGEVSAGVVYATDVAGSTAVRVVAMAPEDSHSPIDFPLVVPSTAPNREAALAFAAWLEGEDARTILIRGGFVVAEPAVK